MTCNHTVTARSAFGNEYCVDCGALVGQPTMNTWAKHMDDSRRANWRDVGDMPPIGEAYYAAWRGNNGRWIVVRCEEGAALPLPATHWSPDLLGLPLGA